MHSNIPMKLISIFSFIILLFPPVFSTDLVLKHGCQDRCENISIPYPFGVGSDCSLDPAFSITCNTSTIPPKPYLSIINKEVVEINQTYIRVKYPYLISACYDLSDNASGSQMNVTAESYKHSMSVNLSGTPYTLSSSNLLTAIGCDDAVLQYNGSSIISGCSAFCADKNDTAGVGYCPNNGSSLGNGCCQVEFSQDTTLLGAIIRLVDVSRKLGRRRLFPCSYAFFQEWGKLNETAFSYPLSYLENSMALQNDNWASSTRPPVVRLNWRIGVENCSRAKLNLNTYACRDEKSVCVDHGDSYYYSDYVRGYLCSCVPGYEGNPYLPGGCQTISFTSSIAKYGCPERCGKLSIPFPFGVGPNCYREPSFEIICNTSTNPPIAYLPILNKEIIHLNSTQVTVNYPNLALACYNVSDNHYNITKTEERSLIIDLSGTQYTLSDANRITTIGCDDMLVGSIRKGNRSSIGSSCASICQNRQILLDDYGWCPYGARCFLRTTT